MTAHEDGGTTMDYTLAKGSHTDPNRGRCAMEWVSFIAGEPHSDQPVCVSPVLKAFCIAFNDALEDGPRQRLRPYLTRCIGTAGDGLDEQRAWMATDWLIRVYLPAWLDLAGLHANACNLRALAQVVGAETLKSAEPKLGEARRASAAARLLPGLPRTVGAAAVRVRPGPHPAGERPERTRDQACDDVPALDRQRACPLNDEPVVRPEGRVGVDPVGRLRAPFGVVADQPLEVGAGSLPAERGTDPFDVAVERVRSHERRRAHDRTPRTAAIRGGSKAAPLTMTLPAYLARDGSYSFVMFERWTSASTASRSMP
jgi:hypothetical protein